MWEKEQGEESCLSVFKRFCLLLLGRERGLGVKKAPLSAGEDNRSDLIVYISTEI